MKLKKLTWALSITLLLSACNTSTPIESSSSINTTPSTSETVPEENLATFAGGCFWCLEPAFENLEGVKEAISGYAGGGEEDATYKKVSSGTTNHREAVQVIYDDSKVSYETLLETYIHLIDPTDDGGQFSDRGPQYTTAIYYHNENQKELAEAAIHTLETMGKFTDPIVVKIEPYTTFFPAKEYHQDFYKKSAEYFQRYKEGSGRADFIEENWAKEAALEFSR